MKKIKSKIRQWIYHYFQWVFRRELAMLNEKIRENDIQYQRLKNLLDNLDVSVDVHYRANSWAVISIQGHRSDFIKFVDLGRSDIDQIYRFLRQFDRSKIDAEPRTYELLKFPRRSNRF